ncbi:MAG: NADH-quinone oxidoreductase subunit C [Proteobacteria bacterium]|nr:NADH-quinone oxidoreductase subunit C [Pseudomonadota bacterium]
MAQIYFKLQESLETLLTAIGPDLQRVDVSTSPISVFVFPANIVRVLMFMRDHPKMRFSQLVDLAGVDYPQNPIRYQLVYHLLSHTTNQRLMVKISCDTSVPISSVINVYPNANWYEREVWDMFGIPFDNHPDLRRILCDYNFSGHPLRKDFPVSGYNEVYFNKNSGQVEYKELDLGQPFRKFDFLSPWEGQWDELLKKETEVHQ